LFVCQIYVDDIIFGSTNKSTCEEFSRIMIQKFEMSMMGELKYFLGFQVKQLEEGTFISQTKYIKDILTKFGMKDAKPINTPMGTNGHLDLDTGGKSVDQKVYRSMIGSLLYLCASRPDIMLSVCICARFQADPKEVHLRAMKTIMRYLVYTPKFGLWYPKGSTFDLIGYSDADWAGCKIDRKSTVGVSDPRGPSTEPTSEFVAACPCPDGLMQDETQGGMRLILSCTRVLVVGVTSVAREGVKERERESLALLVFSRLPSPACSSVLASLPLPSHALDVSFYRYKGMV
jgi:hypothetical protein